MTSDRKQPGMAFWATMVAFVAFVAYPLSSGPFIWLAQQDYFPPAVAAVPIYAPLQWLADRVPPFRTALHWYLSLWTDLFS
jgi:hypothetical protein